MSTTTLADIERLCWHLSGWNVEQRAVDELLAAIRDHMGCGCAGAAAPLDSRGPGDAPQWRGPSADLVILDEAPASAPVRPVEALSAAPAMQDAPAAANGAQAGVQALHVTGTLTLVCGQTCTAAGPKAATPARKAAPPAPRKGSVPDPSEETRVCRKCETRQGIEQFTRDPSGRSGRKTVCRTCENKRKRESRERLRKERAA